MATSPSVDAQVKYMQDHGVPAADIQNYLAQQQGASGAQNPDVFWGSWSTNPPGAPALTGFPGAQNRGYIKTRGGNVLNQNPRVQGQTRTSSPDTRSSEDAVFWLQDGLFKNDPKALDVKKKLIEAGIVPQNADLTDVMTGWARFVSLSAGALTHGQYISPFDYLDMWHNSIMHDQGTPTTTTTTSTNVLNPADVGAAYQQTAQQALGRRATTAEQQAAAGKVGALAAASPTTTTSTSRTVGGKTTTSQVTNQGMGAAGVDEALMQQAMQSPDYGAYQAAGHYFPALLSALSAVNQAGA
jgi:hypothetical protein